MPKAYHIDPHAPRYHPTRVDILSLYKREGKTIKLTGTDFYKNLRTTYPNLSLYTDQQIMKHIEGFNKHLRDVAIQYKDGVQLPAQMGTLAVCTMGKRTTGIDRKTSNEKGYRVYHRNDASEGYGVGLYYTGYHSKEYNSKPMRMFTNCEFWSVYPNKEFRTLMSKAYKEDWKRFWVIPKSRRINDMVDTYQKQLKTKKIVKQITDKYSEFDFKRKKK
jgi:hypothetical protein